MASHDRRTHRPLESLTLASPARFAGAPQRRPNLTDPAPSASSAVPRRAITADAREPRARVPRVERLVTRSGTRTALAVGGTLAALIVVALAGRISGPGLDRHPAATLAGAGIASAVGKGPGTADGAGRPSGNGQPMPAAGSAILTSPSQDVLWSGSALMPVSGVAGPDLEAVQVVLSAGAARIGGARLPVVAGRFRGTLAIIPPATRATAVLEVFDAGAGSRAAAEVRFPIESGRLLLLTSPEASGAALETPMVVAGIVYADVPEVRIVLTGGSDILAESRVTPSPARGAAAQAAGAVSTFSTLLRLPAADPGGPARLHVMALRGERGAELGHADLALVVATAGTPG